MKIFEDVYDWLANEFTMAGQSERLTDVRLSETLPPHVSVNCRRCGAILSSVPCIECLCEEELLVNDDSAIDLCDDYSVLENDAMGYSMQPLLTPMRPTDALPGTPEKIQVMKERVDNDCSPFHPRDKR